MEGDSSRSLGGPAGEPCLQWHVLHKCARDTPSFEGASSRSGRARGMRVNCQGKEGNRLGEGLHSYAMSSGLIEDGTKRSTL